MNVVLIGASGFVGKAILNELLQKGHQVTAPVLALGELDRQPGLTVVKGDVNETEAFSRIVKGHDAVISAFNAGWSNPELYNDFLKGSKAIQHSVKAAGVNRLLVSGGAGSLFMGDKQLVDLPDFPSEWKAGAAAARDYLNILSAEQELDWVFISPAIEMHPGTSGTRKGQYRKGKENPVFDENGRTCSQV